MLMVEDSENEEPRSNRILILAAAGLIIAGLTAWRMANPRHNDGTMFAAETRRPAPPFQLYEQGTADAKPRLVNLDAYLHRHRIVIAFYDGQKGPEADPILRQLREFQPALKRENIIVFGVSTALPQENRNNSSQPFPFRLLSDVTATKKDSVHRIWGRFVAPESTGEPPGTKPGVFIIDRAGLVAWEGDAPKPDDSPQTVVSRLLRE